MDEIILDTVKKLAGMDPELDAFDTDIKLYINSVFSTLNQLGVGPPEGYSITDGSQTWDDYSDDLVLIGFLKPYIGMKVKLTFDPPASNALLNALKESIDELQWRIQVHKEETDRGNEVKQ